MLVNRNRNIVSRAEELPFLRHLHVARYGYHYIEELALCMYGLTALERRIAHLMLQGFVYQEIADELFRSESTIKANAHRIFEKVDVKDRRAFVQHINALIESL